MIKQQPPTAARVEWLLGKNEIDIVPDGDRRRLKGPRKDYLQEYEIRERAPGNRCGTPTSTTPAPIAPPKRLLPPT